MEKPPQSTQKPDSPDKAPPQKTATKQNTLEKTLSGFLNTQPEIETVLAKNLPNLFPKNPQTPSETLPSEGKPPEAKAPKAPKAPKRPPGRPRKHPKPEADAPKRPPGRPRKHPKPDPNAPKRPPGRPRKHPKPNPDAPKRPPGRPRKHPKPDPNAPKRPPGRPRKQEGTQNNQATDVPAENAPEEHVWHWGEEDPENPEDSIPSEALWHWDLSENQEPEPPQEYFLGLDEMEIQTIQDFLNSIPSPTPKELFPKSEIHTPKITPEETEKKSEDESENESENKEEDKEDSEEENPAEETETSHGIPYDPENTEKDRHRNGGNTEIIELYYREIRDHPPLSLQEEQELSYKYKKEGCLKSRDKMVHANLKLVVHIAKKFRGMLRMFSSSMSFIDLISEGNIGLLKAIERYEPERGNKISTYASWWICQQIQSGIQKQGKLIRIPTHLLQKMRKIQRIINEYQQEHEKEKTLDLEQMVPQQLQDMLEAQGFKLEDALSLRSMMNVAAPASSLDETISTGKTKDNGGEGPQLHESLEDPNAQSPYEAMALLGETDYITEILETLPPKERAILIARFGLNGGEEQTLEQVGNTHNLTRERIRQIQDSALKKLKSRILERRRIEETHQN